MFPQNFNLDNSKKDAKLKKNCLISNSTLEEFLTTTLTFLYDEYIDRPKLSEQKKLFEYLVPPPKSGVGRI